MRLSSPFLLKSCGILKLCHGFQHVLHDAPDPTPAQANANLIFNAVNSAMREWGSSIHHNGMSFIPASIPQGTVLYHGNFSPNRATGMEWLSFEIDHSEMFALGYVESDIGPLDRPSRDPGYLHIFRTNRVLDKLLYIDGMAAAKSSLGTIDTQDILLLNTTLHPFDDYVRAHLLCELGDEWGVEGFIRMEAGFEIVFCNFSDGLDAISHRKRPSATTVEGYNDRFLFEYMRSVSQRYLGIGASRVMLDFSSMVSALFFPVNISNSNSSSNLPRLTSTRPEDLTLIRTQVRDIVKRPRSLAEVNWQGVTDLIVSRYKERLKFLADGPPLSSFLSELNHLLNLFMDYDTGISIESSITQCSLHYVQSITVSTPQDESLRDAITAVNRRICAVLFESRGLLLSDKASTNSTVEATVMIQELNTWLDWSVWKSCPPCSHAQVCFVAMWPFGEPQDHFDPGCQNNIEMRKRQGWGSYWKYGMVTETNRHRGLTGFKSPW